MPTLYMICGKAASGKSSLAVQLAKTGATIVISEDHWLSALYGEQMSTLKDYVRFSAKLRAALGPHIVTILRSGLSVVMDYPANTVENRAWMRTLFEEAEADHELHVLDVPEQVCLARLHARNAAGEHPFAATEEQFRQITRQYMQPSSNEGFVIFRHAWANDEH